VALTRAKEALRLSYDRTEPPSPFLEEADAEHRLALCARVREGTARPAADWTAADVAWLCVGAGELRLRRFLETWWRPTDAQRRALRAHLRRPEALHEAAAAELRAYAQSGPAHRPSTETPRPDASPPDASRPDAKRNTGPTDTEPPTAPTTDTESSADAEQAASGGRDAAAARADGEPIDRARLRRLWNAFREGRRVVGAALSLDLPEGAVAPPEDVFGVLGGAPEE
jgi:DNA helicase-2/ATP-dependent DNA helicase PcrA